MKMININGIDIVAIVVITCCTFLFSIGYNGFVQGICTMVVAYYFGKKSVLPELKNYYDAQHKDNNS